MKDIQQVQERLDSNTLVLSPQMEISSFRIALPTRIDLHYIVKDQQHNKPTLLGTDNIEEAIILVHGYTDSWRSFEEMLKRLPFDEFKLLPQR